MTDPTNAKEFRLPSGEIMWIDPAAADAAKETTIMGNKSMVAGDESTLKEAPKDGLYQIGPRGVFRFKRGDKMPVGAKLLEGNERPAGRALGKAGSKKATGKRAPKPSETGESSGPSETS